MILKISNMINRGLFKKFGLIFISMIMMVSSFSVGLISNVNAATYNVTETFDTDWEHDGAAWGPGTILKANGEVVWCIENEKPCITGTSETITPSEIGLTAGDINKLALIAWYGYRVNPTTTNYFLTQNAVWQYTNDVRGISQGLRSYVLQKSGTYSTRSAVDTWVENIMQKVDHFNDLPSFHGKTYTVNMGETLTITDTNNVLSGLAIVSVSGATVSKEGNKLKVTPLSNAPDNLTIIFNRGMSLAQTKTNFVVRSGSNGQATSRLTGIDPYNSRIRLKVQKNGNVKLVKKDNKGNYVPNVQFKISYHSDMSDPIGTYTTGNDGTVIATDILAGTAYVQESSVPNHLILDNTVHSVTVEPNDTVTYTATNQWKQGYIKFIKKDAETGKVVKKAGTVVDIYNSNHAKVASMTTNGNGIAVSGLLDYGTYYVKESKAPDKYTIKVEVSSNIGIVENGKIYEVSILNQRVKGTVNLSKVDGVNGKTPLGEATLEGAIYGLYARNDILDPADNSLIYNAGKKIAELTTDKNGNASISNLYLGNYYLKEISPSNGYTLDETEYDFSLTYKDQNTSVVTHSQAVKERVISRAFSIIKISSNEPGEAELLKGAEFTIKSQKDIDKYGSWEKAPIALNAEGRTTKVLVTDERGYAVSDRLPIGTYVVRETKVPDDKYKVSDFTVIVNEDSSEPLPYRVFNDLSFMSVLAIVKTDKETGKIVHIEGAKFRIKNTDTNEYFGYWSWNPLPHYVDTWTTDETGTVMTEKEMKPGNYQLEEIETPQGYLLNERPLQFKITSNGAYQTLPDGTTPVITVKFSNEAVKGRINVEKKGEVFTDFIDGKCIYETRSLPGMKVNILAKTDILDPSNDGTILYHAGEVVDTIVTGEDGKATSRLLPLGMYDVQEIQAPDGMVLNTEKKTVVLKYADENTSVVFDDIEVFNERPKVEFEFAKNMETPKYHQFDAVYKDVVFGIYAREEICNYKGEVVIEKDTLILRSDIDETGYLMNIPDLPNGAYYLKELETNENYVLDTNEYDFEVAYQGQDVPSYTVVIGNSENNLKRGSIYVKKFDSYDYDKKMKDIEFQISSDIDMKNIVTSVKTDENGIASFENMEIGRYYIREARQVDGYILNDQIYEVEITGDGEHVTIHIDNKPIKMYFSKVDETGVKELEGAHLQVLDKDRNIIDEWISTDSSHEILYLTEGKEYIMREIIAPDGYEIAEEIVFVAGSGKKVTMKDELILTDIQVNKVDEQTNKVIISKDFEFTMYADKELTQVLDVVHADTEDGTATFKDVKPFQTVYIKETKAPIGYKLSDEVKVITVDDHLEGYGDIHSFIYTNSLLPVVVVKAGDTTNIIGYAIIGLASLPLALFLFKGKKKKINKN